MLIKTKERRIFGRRSGRPLNKGQKAAMEAVFPLISLSPDDLPEDGGIAPASLLEKPYEQYVYEIGFGMGEHLAALMKEQPHTGFLGAEPFINGMAAFCKQIGPCPNTDDLHDLNARVVMDDAMYLARSLEDECLDDLYILNPDPWHKSRHHKRRIINSENLDHFARILKPGGRLISSTDVPYLAESIVTHVVNHPAFVWTVNTCSDWKNRPAWWLDNKYASKGAKGASQMHYFIFRKT